MRVLFVLTLGALAFPCAPNPPPTQIPVLDVGYFAAKVEPELLKSCAYGGCHGAPNRPLRIFSLGSSRLESGGCLTPVEHTENYVRALAAAAPVSAGLPDLLRKPLQLEAGGSGHGGVDAFGRNVYASKDDEGYRTLEAWVAGATFDGGWVEPECVVVPDDPDAGVTLACMPRPGNFYPPVAAIVTKATCAKEAGCHTPENSPDAGCFIADDTCEGLRRAGCVRRAVLPCDLQRSRLLQYTGARPWGVKSHQGVLLPMHAQAIAEWIDGGASCDGGGFFP